MLKISPRLTVEKVNGLTVGIQTVSNFVEFLSDCQLATVYVVDLCFFIAINRIKSYACVKSIGIIRIDINAMHPI